jgi:hypothetical protein
VNYPGDIVGVAMQDEMIALVDRAAELALIGMIGDLASLQMKNRDANTICEDIARIIADGCAKYMQARTFLVRR